MTEYPKIGAKAFFPILTFQIIKSYIAEIEKFKKEISTKRNVLAKRES